MARPRTITNTQILESALAVFLDRGFGATTADIARRAGVSEGTLFKRFASKGELFLAAIAPNTAPCWFATVDEMITHPGEDIREDIQRIADELLVFFETLVPRMSVLMASPYSPQDLMQRMDRHPVASGIRRLTDWFDAEMRRGRLRPTDPEVAARMLIGALKGYAFDQQLHVNEHLPMPRAVFLRGAVDMLLRGLLSVVPDGATSAPELSEHSP